MKPMFVDWLRWHASFGVRRMWHFVRQSDGSYDFPGPYTKGSASRTIYVGVEATNPFTFADSTLQGMVDNGSDNSAPIQIDLTYTLIK